jgi:nicotinate-nucleotide pyrophosphorylase (carboxylating)
MSPDETIRHALQEDIGAGDHTSLATIPETATGTARLLIKEAGVIAGIDVAENVFQMVDKRLKMQKILKDGNAVSPGDIAFTVHGSSQSIVTAERTVLNFMQRMSGIATNTRKYVAAIEGLHTRLLDTRKTTPNMRWFEKYAVRAGGAENHRTGLYDMIMVKDNHVDYAGGIRNAIQSVQNYQRTRGISLKVEIEVRSMDELSEVLAFGGVDRIMLDNFSPEQLREALTRIGGKYETEASGGITFENLRDYAETGVDFISVGALTHHIRSLDMSLKASDH